MNTKNKYIFQITSVKMPAFVDNGELGNFIPKNIW